MFFVYIIQSQKTNKYYIGHTVDFEDRLSRHNRGAVRSTKYGVPWKPIHLEQHQTKSEAYRREMEIKSYKGGILFMKLLINKTETGEVA